MVIHGFQKLTLLDYPGKVACTLFSGGCNFRCPFCQNGNLVQHPEWEPVIPEEEIFAVLEKRRGVLDGVCVTGGEPTLDPDLERFVTKIKELGYLVKLDTNGYRPEILKESARTAISYIHAHADDYDIPERAFKDKDIHIHVPEGAIPKDGPSAGITIATAVFSALTGKGVRNDVAMTGEITLRGKVLPIGGLKEKSLAAMRAGIKKVLIPVDNMKDLADIPESVKNGVKFIPVENVSEVFNIAIER